MSNNLSFKIDGSPDYAFLTVQVPQGETIKVEAGGMAFMSTQMKMKTKMQGGFKRMLAGESLFISEYSAEGGNGEIGIAPGTPGDLAHVHLEGNTVFLQNSAFLASTMGVELDAKFQGFKKGFFSGEKMFMVRCSGNGDLWFNTYGALLEIDVSGSHVVDTGYIVAFSEGLTYDIQAIGGMKSTIFSGEGLVCRFSGQGKLWIQTRLAPAFVHWADKFRPIKTKSKS